MSLENPNWNIQKICESSFLSKGISFRIETEEIRNSLFEAQDLNEIGNLLFHFRLKGSEIVQEEFSPCAILKILVVNICAGLFTAN